MDNTQRTADAASHMTLLEWQSKRTDAYALFAGKVQGITRLLELGVYTSPERIIRELREAAAERERDLAAINAAWDASREGVA